MHNLYGVLIINKVGGEMYLHTGTSGVRVYSTKEEAKESGDRLYGDKNPHVACQAVVVAQVDEADELPAPLPTELDVARSLLAALVRSKVYVEGAYECAFPDDRENDSVNREIAAAVAKAARIGIKPGA